MDANDRGLAAKGAGLGSGNVGQQGIFSDIRIYKKDLGQTVCEELTSFD